ncbi:glycosyltransferase family 2 protein [Claveliimonas bilis]|nr:glycosyltransferase family 2 protein [Claveliimonas bilis]MCQ5203592.1 glycosyltransferase family 2 protein [Mordavella massiliensis]BDZ80270.1 glycosyl transferase [Claveliimonas bilis]BDZ83858.1 glycosyl transferase [Claveliimonas bilis]
MERTVIIPALNPDEGLREIVERNWELENQIILVDDGSDKKYERLFWELGEKCIVLHHEENRGKGEAIKTALKYIKEELWECRVVGIMDADGQHLPDDMEKLLMKAAAEPMALIVGSRTIDRNVPWKSRMGNLITRRIFRMKTGVEVSDTQTGLRAFSTRLLDFMLDIEGERYEYEMNVLVTCAKANIPIIEVPIETIYHDKGNSCSHFRKVRDSVRIYRQLLKFSFVSFSSFLLDYVMLAGLILVLNNILLQIFLAVYIPLYPAKILTECTLFLISWLIQKKLIFSVRKSVGIKYPVLIKKSGERI